MNDFTFINDTFTLSDDALLQCVPISITSDSITEPDQECFSFTLSTETSIDGLTLSPSEAEICISDAEGNDLHNNYIIIIAETRDIQVLPIMIFFLQLLWCLIQQYVS